ncbi:glycosyl hydrolase family 65 protein [Actinomadura sp. NTSP31]
MTTQGGTLHLNPRLPAAIGELRLGLRYRGTGESTSPATMTGSE